MEQWTTRTEIQSEQSESLTNLKYFKQVLGSDLLVGKFVEY